MTVVGDNLKRYRKAFGYSQHALARRSGVHQPIISYVEAGKHEPEFHTVRKLARALGLPISALVDDGPPPGPPPPPRTPRTDESEAEFKRRFEVLDGTGAGELRAELDGEFAALEGYVRRVTAETRPGPEADESLALRQAREKVIRCAVRLQAATFLWTDVDILRRERKTFDEYAASWGEVGRWMSEVEERRAAEASGEASGASA